MVMASFSMVSGAGVDPVQSAGSIRSPSRLPVARSALLALALTAMPLASYAQPAGAPPEVGQPEAGQPEAGQSEAGQPEDALPDNGQRGNEKPENRLPEIQLPEIKLPENQRRAATVEARHESDSPAPSRPDAGGDEVIVITGSLVERHADNLTGLGPITRITAEDIATSGVVTIDELLQRLPSVTAQGAGRGQGGDSKGLAFIDLRHLGVQRPLVLVNGRRFVASGTGVNEAVDLNNIPVAMIERIEVLLDGASAIYGSDAVAGVVNIILKRNFEGLRVDALSGITDKGDGETLHLSATMGSSVKRGNVMINVSYLVRSEIAQRDRDWARNPVVHARFANGMNDANGIEELIGSAAPAAGRSGDAVFIPDANMGASFQPFGAGHRFNHGLRQWLVGSQELLSTTILGHYDLLRKRSFGGVSLRRIEAYVEGMYTTRLNRTVLAPQDVGLAGTASFPDGLRVPLSNPYIPDDFRSTLAPGTETIPLARTLTEMGDRLVGVESDNVRVVTGVRGRLSRAVAGERGTQNMDYRWDLFLNVGRSRSEQTILNAVDLARVLDTVDPERCAAARGCVVGNYFGENSLTPEVLSYLRYADVELTGYDQFILGGTMDGNVYPIPRGGMVRAALGYTFKSEAGLNRPSAVTIRGDAAGSARDTLVGNYSAHEVFGEVSAPILDRMRGAHELTVDLAGRWSGYSPSRFGPDLGSKAIYRAALGYAPIADVRVRSSYSTSFRVPGISQLFGGAADSLLALSDPCNQWDTDPAIDPVVRQSCQDAGVPAGYDQHVIGSSRVRTSIGGNPNLEPEIANLLNLGMVLRPRFANTLSLTADYYRIRVDNAITNPDPQSLLTGCHASPGLSSPRCAAVTRGPDGSIVRLDAFSRNIDRIETSGVDISLDYRFALRAGSELHLAWQGNILLDYAESLDGDEDELAGTIAVHRGSYTRLRWAMALAYLRQPWSARSTLRFIGPAQVAGVEPGSRPYDSVPAVFYWDLAGAYRMGTWSAVVGINNVLDRAPPFLLDGNTNASAGTHDVVGRYFFARMSRTF
jgi:iron complex outermembrane recepter protein